MPQLAKGTTALRVLFALAALLALSDRPPSATARTAAGIVQAANQARGAAGLRALAPDQRLVLAAREYARELAEAAVLSHRAADGSTIADRAQAAGYAGWSFLGENLASGPACTSPRELVGRWLASDGHRTNLLSPEARETGAGCANSQDGRLWCVQVFGRRDAPGGSTRDDIAERKQDITAR